ncbi:MAG: cytochrome C oxidase subunit IV family protein [Chloroflexi bacterium]|nr:cytochrome C oxidase subunit IV family protein [Chloroflexota bacterium]MBV9892817.1 cytochrome C oxidase subunit IV family protein [Chloroflexota bacterium]
MIAHFVTTLVLLVLTALNIGIAQLDLGPFNTVLALGIATIEVVIMAVVFMRVRSSPAMTRLVAVAGLFWLGILMSGTLDDILTRNWLPIPGK